MFTYLQRIWKTAWQHIRRNPWLSLASVCVIMLAFFLSSVFGGLLYASNIVLDYLETQSHIYVFFKNGTEEEYILNVKTEIERYFNPESVEYTSEEAALAEFQDAYKDNPLIVESITEDVLPASLGIRSRNLEDIPQVLTYLDDIQQKDDKIEHIKYRQDVTEKIQKISKIIKIAGISVVSFLGTISFLIVLITVGITISNYQEEIQIMQLVGASRSFVRWPFIISGALYGAIGAIFSTLTLTGLVYAGYYYLQKAGLYIQIVDFIRGVPMPHITIWNLTEIIGIKIALGILIGALSSTVSVRKYIK